MNVISKFFPSISPVNLKGVGGNSSIDTTTTTTICIPPSSGKIILRGITILTINKFEQDLNQVTPTTNDCVKHYMS